MQDFEQISFLHPKEGYRRAFDKQLQKFCQHEQASTHRIFASNSSKGQILRALLN